MYWLWLSLWMALSAGVMITSHVTKARGDKPSRALWEAIVANLIFGALLSREGRNQRLGENVQARGLKIICAKAFAPGAIRAGRLQRNCRFSGQTVRACAGESAP